MPTRRFISLFSGIGGLDLGLEQAGLKCVHQVEKDEWRRSILNQRWPDCPRENLVESVNAETLPEAEVLVGGFPCQDISKSNRHAEGLDGVRSGMWWHFARLIRDVRPRVVLVENVPALRSRGLGAVLGPLATCGYDAIWDCLPAQSFGAHHERDRLFVVAWLASDPNQKPVRFGSERRPWAGWQARAPVGQHAEPLVGSESTGWKARPPLARMGHGLPARVFAALGENDRRAERVQRQREKAIGDAVCPPVASYLGQAIIESLGG